MDPKIKSFRTHDIRFPTSKELDGSDAVHTDPDYSAAYVVLATDEPGLEGHGLAFTIGRGNEIVTKSIEALRGMVVGRGLGEITRQMAAFWRELVNESQLRWIGPEKGAIHMAVAAVVNAIWDLWAKWEEKPLWRLVVELSPDDLIACIDFRYLSDALRPQDALEMLLKNEPSRSRRVEDLLREGYPAYITSAGWMGYSDEKIRNLCHEAMERGWRDFKIKVGRDRQEDRKRSKLVRDTIGAEGKLMVDANQAWDVPEAIDWMRDLTPYDIWWIEEPTSPDDILGHAAIRQAIAPIGVATGECCANRVIFKQLLEAEAIDFVQIDACRLGGVNEALAVMLLAAKFGKPVCPHSGGVGLCEYVQHLVAIDYIRISASLENRMVEYADHLHEHFRYPCRIKNGRYLLPEDSGYSVEMKTASIERFAFPDGPVWRGFKPPP